MADQNEINVEKLLMEARVKLDPSRVNLEVVGTVPVRPRGHFSLIDWIKSIFQVLSRGAGADYWWPQWYGQKNNLL